MITFREYVIEIITNSTYWQKCIMNGIEDELPVLANLSHSDLLKLFIYSYSK